MGPRIVVLALLAGCYQAELGACDVRCADQSRACPAGMVCGADDFCHTAGDLNLCMSQADDGAAIHADGGGGGDGTAPDGLMLLDALTPIDGSDDPCFGLCTGELVCTAPCNCCCLPTNTQCCLQC